MADQSKTLTLLIIDDDPLMVEFVTEALAQDGLEILSATDPQAGLALLIERRPHVALIDLVMPTLDGMQILEQVMERALATEVLLITGQYSTDSAVEAIHKGARDYLPKPMSVEKLQERVGRVLDDIRRRQTALELDRQLIETYRLEGLIGRSPNMLEMFARIQRIAPHFRTALITGETGTGKELVARALQRLSPVSKGPFAVCNCAAIVETLFESELFGHVKGAFTGAVQDKVGLFEYANGGTVFLDEIGEMPLASQAKLLRVLQHQEVHRVGSPSPRKVDVRVVAATNRDLKELVAEKKFREDLFYRLGMVEIKLPKLSDRNEDLPLLQRHFLQNFAHQYGKTIKGLTRRAQALLARYHWPGNVRELENLIGHAVMMAEREVIDLADIQPFLQAVPAGRRRGDPAAPPPGAIVLDTTLPLAEVERRYIEEVLRRAGSVPEAARQLGVPKSTLYAKLKTLRATEGSCAD